MDKKTILDNYTQCFILKYYPEVKQKSDDIDWKVHTTRLITYSNNALTTDQIAKLVYESSAKILNNTSSFEDELNYLCQIFDLKDSWEQLLKVGIRSGWVNLIKSIYYEILNDESITTDKLYFAVKEKYIPLTKFLP